MSATIRTYRDAVDRLLDLFDIDPTERNKRMARSAVQTAYRELPQMARWSYFERHLAIRTSPPYSTGTVDYDHEGGAYPRLVTLTGGAWPNWAAAGRLVIGKTKYDVARRLSDTQIQLGELSSPAADVPGPMAYSLERSQYELPLGFRSILRVYDLDRQRALQLTTPETIRDHTTLQQRTPSNAFMAAVVASGDTYGREALLLGPTPVSECPLDIYYETNPRPLWTEYDAGGTVSVTSGSATVTAAINAFKPEHVGAMFRLSAIATLEPTDETGSRITNACNPYIAQRRVIEYVSPTSILVDSPFTNTLAGVRYAISDPIDIEPSAMWTAFMRLAEAELAGLVRSEDVHARRATALKAVRLALEADQRQPMTSSRFASGFSYTITTTP